MASTAYCRWCRCLQAFPWGTLAIGRAGAVNAALLSAAILALNDEAVSQALLKFRAEQSAVTVDLSEEE